MSLTVATIRSVCTGVMLIAAASACTRDKAEPADTAAAAPPAATAAGQWTSPVNNISAATIAQELTPASGKWPVSPGAALRRCKGTPACNRPSNPATVWVRVWAAAGAKDVGHRNIPPNQAVMIGKIQNHGQDTTDAYNLAPNRVYAVYLMQDASGNGRYEIWGVQGSKKTMAAAGKQSECIGHEDRKWDYSFAIFATCASSPTKQSEVSGSDSVIMWASAGASTTALDDPAWFTCTSGCCTADVQ